MLHAHTSRVQVMRVDASRCCCDIDRDTVKWSHLLVSRKRGRLVARKRRDPQPRMTWRLGHSERRGASRENVPDTDNKIETSHFRTTSMHATTISGVVTYRACGVLVVFSCSRGGERHGLGMRRER
jgi:hypothetical protein